LRGNNNQPITDNNCRLLDKEKYLIYQRRTRKSILTVRSKHDVIGHIHAIRNKVLQ
jgi:hypothetical protein